MSALTDLMVQHHLDDTRDLLDRLPANTATSREWLRARTGVAR